MKKQLFLFVFCLLPTSWAAAATVSVLSVPSAKMGRNIPITLILPYAYTESETPLPVVYLLHGAGGNHTGWNRSTGIAQLADVVRIHKMIHNRIRVSHCFFAH